PFAYHGLAGTLPRGKAPLPALEAAQRDVAELAAKAGIDFAPALSECVPSEGPLALRISGARARQFLQGAATADLAPLSPGNAAAGYLLDEQGRLIDKVTIEQEAPDGWGQSRYLLRGSGRERLQQVVAWLRSLSDGYTIFGESDIFSKVEGPVKIEIVAAPEGSTVRASGEQPGAPGAQLYRRHPERFALRKTFFVGQRSLAEAASVADKAAWSWREPELPVRRTPLYEHHRSLGAKMVPFAGWEMPVWYTSVSEEHRAVREAAGLFDVAHMGVFEVEGPHATTFLDAVCSNYIAWLDDGQSCYAYLLDPAGQIIDDVMVYHCQPERYLMVVNASNEAKDWDWLSAVNERRVVIDQARPWVEINAPAVLRNLKDPCTGARQRRDLALQGPASLATLQALAATCELRDSLARIRRTELTECELVGIPLVIARTGYTGEDIGYEILVHPDRAAELWQALLEAGAPFGVRPAGLGARDSTRTEAGLPLYGHELAGPFAISPIEAGFPGYVKYHKPFFVGRQPLLDREADRSREIVRFRLDEKGVRRPQLGDPVTNRKGQIIGQVTSCSIDADGYLLGLAIIDRRYTSQDTALAIFVTGGAPLEETLLRGSRVTLPIGATVLSRFRVQGAVGGTSAGE
ncbi:MAG: glycine cleavage system aminomethyltransferase GcvT, partial [Anaerolineales bacterium]|nr:glycine cleavage system aminomethyltransferase GcvT [Anaerolineales bacterium]